MANGIEKRRFKRMKADLSLNVSSLFKQDNMEIKNLYSPIKVINISEGGIAFESTFILMLLLILALKQILFTVLSRL